MDIFNILTEIINNPQAKRYYLELEKYYKDKNMIHESEVIKHIIETILKENEQKTNGNNNN